jgi:phosphinothricin acetyltransferase
VRYRPKAAYQTTVETSIYLSQDATGRGIETRLYTALFEALRGQDLHRALAGVTLPNPASVSLHRHLGFERAALYREVGRKFGRYWDVAWFQKDLA